MKLPMFFLSVIILTSCASAIRLSPLEQCAMQDMKLSGVTTGQGSASAWNYYSGTTVASSSYYGVSCEVPKNDQDRCEIERTQWIAAPKAEYNSDISTKKLLTGLGYYAFIAPGVVAKVVYDNQKDEALKKSQQIARDTFGKCSSTRVPASE